MAITARTQQGLTTEEKKAVRKFFIDHPELGEGAATTPTEQLTRNVSAFEDYLTKWNVVVTDESLQKTYGSLRAVPGVLQITSEARMKFAEASKGHNQGHQDILDGFFKRVHLVCEQDDDRTFENSTAFYRAMAGRQWTDDNLTWVLQY